MDSNTRDTDHTVEVYVRLLNEGTETYRPARGLDLGNGLFRLTSATPYDPDDEDWEFPPDSVVALAPRKDENGSYLVAVDPANSAKIV